MLQQHYVTLKVILEKGGRWLSRILIVKCRRFGSTVQVQHGKPNLAFDERTPPLAPMLA